MNFFNICFLSMVVVLTACHENKKHTDQITGSFKVIGNTRSSCPYLTSDTSGTPVLSWVQQDKEGAAQVYYALFSDSAKAFGMPRPVPSSKGVQPHGENMPKLIYAGNGKMLLVFGVKNPHPGNPYTGAVYYTWSFDKGKHWKAAQPLINDSSSYDQRYFDVALLPDGNVGIIWLSNSKPEGSTLCFARFDKDGTLFDKKILARHTCQCCRTDLMVDDSGIIHLAWRNIFSGSVRDMAYCYSADTGKTFSVPVRISPDNWVVDGCPHTGPCIVENKEGLYFSWFTMGGGPGVYFCCTRDQGKTFSPRKAVSTLASARHPQMTVMADQNLVIVWDEGIKNKNKWTQHIGLQLRGPSGIGLSTSYLTPEKGNATFPQIEMLNKTEAIVAYTLESGRQFQIRYRLLRL